MVLQSLLFMAACVLVLAVLRVLPRWVQALVIAAGCLFALLMIADGVIHLDGGLLLGGLMLLGGCFGVDAVLRSLRRDAASPSVGAPGGAAAPGAHGERARGGAALSDSGGSAAGERDAPILPGGFQSTAGRAGRPRSFSEVSR